MLSRRSLVLTGSVLVALSSAPVAEARLAADAAAAKKPRLASLRSVPATVEVGQRFRVRGRVTNLPRKKSVRLTLSLRRSGRAIQLRSVKLRRPKRGSSRSFSVRVAVPRFARAGSYRLRACVKQSCRSKRLKVSDKPVPGPGPTPPGPGPEPARPSPRPAARRAQPAHAADRRELLLRDGRPLLQRRHEQ